jgi:glycosyltransferase family protein
MNLRYSSLFRTPRKIVKHFLSFLYPLVIRVWKLPTVLSIEETIQLLIVSRISLARFGDSEFLYIVDKLNLPYQKYDEKLSSVFKEMLRDTRSDLLVGLPSGYHSMKSLTKEGQRFWRSQITYAYPRLSKYLLPGKIYGNASITRLYYEIEDKELSKRYFNLIRKIWEGKSILIVEGSKSRLGVGNDLFANAKLIGRVLAPKHNAYEKFQEILNAVREIDQNVIILIALGPTAKAVVFELTKMGYQAIDIGNLDIEYEWFRQSAKEKVKIAGKYTSEAIGGREVEDIFDEEYKNQIIVNLEH